MSGARRDAWRAVIAAATAVVVVVVVVTAGACGPARAPAPPEPPPLSASALLTGGGGGDPAAGGFERAVAARPFAFPADHGPHAAFRSEWWYLTGVLDETAAAPAGGPARRLGYQLTIFRQALVGPGAPPRPSAWGAGDVYMAHLALSDVDGAATGAPRFAAHERFARGGRLGLAGAAAAPFAVWVGDWRMEARAPAAPDRGGGSIFPLRLTARADGDAVELTVDAGRGPIAEGEHGLAAKGPRAGEASYYYSLTRLPTRGRLTIAGRAVDVAGTSWLDREWSTGALGADVVGWDWLGAELSDGRDVMIYRLRTKDGGVAAESRATLIAAGGAARVLPPDAFDFQPLGAWISPRGGTRYPAAFRLRVPSERLDVTVRPMQPDQELPLSVHYWEGAAAISGAAAGAPLTGRGYLELTGYDADAGAGAGGR
jgi:predicted secreted hydrolase